jgi:urate oxidase
MPTLGANRYGKCDVRLVKVARLPDRSDIKEIKGNIFLEGDFKSCYHAGDNSRILPTDTLKNTVYALARNHSLDPIEDFALALVNHFLADNPQVERVSVELVETLWNRIAVGGEPQCATFEQQGPEKHTCAVAGSREKVSVSSGVDGLVLLKASGSAFQGFIRDGFTTLPETKDRLLKTDIRAEWRFADAKLPFNDLWRAVLETLKLAFARHQSRSLQHTLFEMGQAVLSSIAEIEEIYLTMPNKHCHLVDLSPFGLDNPNEVFVPSDEPYGLIEARLTR